MRCNVWLKGDPLQLEVTTLLHKNIATFADWTHIRKKNDKHMRIINSDSYFNNSFNIKPVSEEAIVFNSSFGQTCYAIHLVSNAISAEK